MVAHNEYKQPGLSQWTGSAVTATISLDQAGGASFTNLDEISGRVIVRAGKSVDLHSIIVKLEGESRTRLMSPGGGPNNDRPRAQLEYHKILYRVQTVFPPAEVLGGRDQLVTKAAYTLPLGQHEYPFSFKIPFNNTCHADRPAGPQLSMLSSGLEIARAPTQHVKKTLPPTLTGFPGEAEIRYFVKVTVGRQSFFKENPRAYVPFTFIPIEAPRPPVSGSELYARQRHMFRPATDAESPKSKGKGIFGRKSSSEPSPTTNDAPSVSVDARLPEPAILTCNSRLPLRLVIKRLNEFPGRLFIHSLQIALIGYTKIRAHEVFRTESNSWIVVSKSNIAIPVGRASEPVGAELVVHDSLWKDQVLPNTVAPSFDTCNISRSYQLDLRVGLSYQADSNSPAKPQSIMLPLRCAAVIYSGIAPPAELLARMAQRKPPAPTKADEQQQDKLQKEAQVPTPLATDQTGMHSNTIPATPLEGPSTSLPIETGPNAPPPVYADAPPSYEDAIASDIRPIVAPRPEYAPPASGEDEVLARDEKRGWRGR